MRYMVFIILFPLIFCIFKKKLHGPKKNLVDLYFKSKKYFLHIFAFCQGCILSPCLFNLYAEYIMRNAGLEKTQAGIRTTGRNINNLRYADDTALNGRK